MSGIYGALSFSGVTKAGSFYSQIWSGRKIQTMRFPRADGNPHVKVGVPFKLYWLMRTPIDKKPVHLIGIAKATRYDLISLSQVWNDEENAKRDGFLDLDEFRHWFLRGCEPQSYLDSNSDWILREKYYVIGWEYPLLFSTITVGKPC